ncbi:alpha/beta fold hydrolase [Sanguibacter sp. YZGR15]|uniref:Alpha/beta fold hydrolase n=1 Tax=Sanguibacter suaedae TaxID=2795737 RepID=A0A934IDT6_9MICO|nr:alpha/beta fold hydrolase [Sanguibacter suaedae]
MSASTVVPPSTPAQDDGRTPRRALRATAVVLGAALVLAGCASPEPKVQSGLETTSDAPTDEPVDRPDEDIPADLVEFYEQEVDWTSCGSFECADILVPLDWDDPTRGSITIGAKRHLAEGTSMGTVLLNPGGPGGSGIEFVEYVPLIWGDPLLESYDVLGFDPRGVGESSAVTCLTDEEKDVYYAKTYPLDDAGLAEMAADAAEFGAKCLTNTGEVLGEVDTQSAARDMDVIRYVVGDEKLNYLGYSYGTQLGATYAGLYPEKVGRMVLDGAIDLRLTPHEQSLQQAVGFENALRAYVEDCQGGTGCPLTGSVDEGMAQVKTLLDSTFANPLPTDDPDGRVLTQTLAFYGIAQPLYSQQLWGTLTSALTSAIDAGDGSELLDSADSYNSRDSDGTYLDNQGEAFRAINCLDDRGSSDRATMDAEYAEIVAAAPTMGEFFGYGGLGCADWPFPVVEKEYDLAATGADPIVVIGTTNDPATPYVWAQGLAEQLESGVLVTYEGEGHTAYGVSNDCILDAVDEYFVDGTVPAEGLTC